LDGQVTRKSATKTKKRNLRIITGGRGSGTREGNPVYQLIWGPGEGSRETEGRGKKRGRKTAHLEKDKNDKLNSVPLKGLKGGQNPLGVSRKRKTKEEKGKRYRILSYVKMRLSNEGGPNLYSNVAAERNPKDQGGDLTKGKT